MQYFMYIMIIFGFFEIISNLYHISKGSIIKTGQSAKKQHQELPLNLNEIHFFIKAVIMLVFGFLFFMRGLLFILNTEQSLIFSLLVFISFGFYGLLQALWYRNYLNVWPASVVYNLPLIIFLFLK
jgi:hypothetical protein